MAKKKTDKAPSEATATTEKKTAKVSANGMVEVVVKVTKFGNYKKGDVLTMEQTTAKACVKKKVVAYN